jgi:hypothetical protein
MSSMGAKARERNRLRQLRKKLIPVCLGAGLFVSTLISSTRITR